MQGPHSRWGSAPRSAGRRARWLAALLGLTSTLALGLTPRAAAQCSEGHAALGRPLVAHDAAFAERLVDGFLVPEGRGYPSGGAAELRATGAVRIDLGGPVRVRSLLVQADATDEVVVEGSADGTRFSPLWTAPAAEGGGFRSRATLTVDATVRAVRLRPGRGDGLLAVTELVVGCRPEDVLVRSGFVRDVPLVDAGELYKRTTGGRKLAFGLVALGVWLAARRGLLGRARVPALAALVSLGLAGFLDFGAFRSIPRGPLHVWDSSHYFLGSKYDEVGYTDLYRCVAAAGHLRGLERTIDGMRMRRLEDNVAVPGTYTRLPAGRCTSLSPARLRALAADLEALRTVRWPASADPISMIADRGYLATPPETAWLRLVTAHTRPDVRTMTSLAVLDFLFLVLAVWAVGWGFGLEAAAAVAVAIGVGEPWSYGWLGGALDRFSWVFAAALGLAALARGRLVLAGVALGVATLVRIFPGFLVVGVALAYLLTDRSALHALLRGLVPTLLAGGLLGAAVAGPTAYGAFLTRAALHERTPVANELGGAPALRMIGPGSDGFIDPGQLDPIVPYQAEVNRIDAERAPLRLVLAGAFAWLVVHLARRGEILPAGFAALAAGLSLAHVASYYAVVLVFLAVARRDERGVVATVGFAIASQALLLLRLDALFAYAVLSCAAFAAVAWATLPTRTRELPRAPEPGYRTA